MLRSFLMLAAFFGFTGVALGAVLTGISFAVTLVKPEVFDRVRFWSAGSLQGRQFDTLWAVLPFIVLGYMVLTQAVKGFYSRRYGWQ